MPFKIRDTLLQMETHLRGTGYITDVSIGEPSEPPITNGIFAAIFLDSASIEMLTLSNTVDRVNVQIRLYQESTTRTTGIRDDELELAAVELESAFLGDVDLGSNVRDIQPLQVVATFGYIDHGGIQFRIMDYIVPFLLDGNATLAA